jgi:hypothetical protein
MMIMMAIRTELLLTVQHNKWWGAHTANICETLPSVEVWEDEAYKKICNEYTKSLT